MDIQTFTAFSDEMQKISEEEKKKSKGLELAKIIGAGTLGFGAGTAIGLGGAHLANMATKRMSGSGIPKSLLYGAAPLLGGAAGIAYAVHKAKEQEAIRNALEDPAVQRAG